MDLMNQMNPTLVEPSIKSIMNSQLNNCKKDKFLRNSMILNIFLFFVISSIISVILFIQYKGKQNIATSKLMNIKFKLNVQNDAVLLNKKICKIYSKINFIIIIFKKFIVYFLQNENFLLRFQINTYI